MDSRAKLRWGLGPLHKSGLVVVVCSIHDWMVLTLLSTGKYCGKSTSMSLQKLRCP